MTTEPYCNTGHILHKKGWNVVSLDIPCHGADQRPGEPKELTGWAARTRQNEDIVAPFQRRVNDVIDHLVHTHNADPQHIAVAGTSRGGFMAFHAAAGNPRIRAVAAIAPVTDLLALREFTGQENNPLVQRLALVHAVPVLADRAAWIIIGNADERVDTAKVAAFALALAATGPERDVTLLVLPVPGHVSLPKWHDDAPDWFQERLAPAKANG